MDSDDNYQSENNKAAMLYDKIGKIQSATREALKSKDTEERQLATAVWVIDRLAFWVGSDKKDAGGDKEADDEDDAVGCCSLRVEHLHFDTKGGDCSREIEFEFLGKDSMLYKQTIDFGAALYNDNDGNGMGKQVFNNFKAFCENKDDSEEIFDKINPTMLNQHLIKFMDGLTTKVFRRYNASKTLQEELAKTEENMKGWSTLSADEKVIEYNRTNREVAILCNHYRSVSKAQEDQLERLLNKLDKLKEQKKVLTEILELLDKDGDKSKIPLKKPEKKMVEAVNTAIKKAKELKEEAKTNAQKIAAIKADEEAKQQRRDAADFKFTQAHLWEKVPTKNQVTKRISIWTGKINKMEMDLKHRDINKELSLGMSKINYMDPRISVAWCKRNKVPIEKIFSETLRDKLHWAMAVPPDWEFNADAGKQK